MKSFHFIKEVLLLFWLTIALLGIYNIFNMYCDIRWRITKVFWHLTFIILFISLIVFQFPSVIGWVLLWGFVVWLIYGLALEKVGSTSPGDTKMMMTNALGICCFTLYGIGSVNIDALKSSLFVFGVTFTIIKFLIDVYRFGKRYGVKRVFTTLFGYAFRFVASRVGLGNLVNPHESLDNKGMILLPGAVEIAISVAIACIVHFPS
jgi:hypothetical protein